MNVESPIVRILQEILAMHNDRAIAVLGGALLDDVLTDAIKSRWRSDDSPRTSAAVDTFIRDGGGALTFGLKIDLAYLTGIIKPDVHADLSIVRNIRNRFAHRTLMDDNNEAMAAVTFSNQQISAWCNNLQIPTKLDAVLDKQPLPNVTPKDKFIVAIAIYSSLLLMFSHTPINDPSIGKSPSDEILRGINNPHTAPPQEKQ